MSEHRPIFDADFMLVGCCCGARFEPGDNDDGFADHVKEADD